MLLTCPGCLRSFDSREPLQPGEINISCPHCQASMIVVTTVKAAGTPRARPSRVLPPERVVLVAVEGTATKEMIQEVLQEKGYEAIMAATGKEALMALEQARPSVALIDVGLPEITPFELCEKIKNSMQFRDTKVILVASIYDKTRYKREPDSLYGADDYIERHDIQNRLVSKIEELLGKRPTPPKEVPAPRPTPAAPKPAPAPTLQGMDNMLLDEVTIYEPTLHVAKPEPRSHVTPPPVEITKSQLDDATIYEPTLHVTKPEPRVPVTPPPVETAKSPPVAGDPAKHEAAKRLARLILSDIALYNQKAVENGIRNNTFHQLLKSELEEGRKLYCSRVLPDVTAATDYYNQAIEEFILKRKGSS
jgi:CheY-like chemotaxis protein